MKHVAMLIAIFVLCSSLWGVYHKVGNAETPSPVRVLSNDGTLLVAGTTDSGLQFFDASVPSSPQWMSTFLDTAYIIDAEIYQDVVYVLIATDEGSEFITIDATDPAQPHILDSYTSTTRYQAMSIDFDSGKACLIRSEHIVVQSYLRVLDVSDPDDISVYSHCCDPHRMFSDVCITGNTVYVSAYEDGILVFDVTYGGGPSHINTIEQDDESYRIEVDGDYLVSCNGSAGIGVYDITTPAEPNFLYSFADTFGGSKVYISGNTLYIAATNRGVNLYERDFTTPPLYTGHYTPQNYGFVFAISAIGDLMYLGNPLETDVDVIDTSEPGIPSAVLSSCVSNNQAVGVEVHESHAFLADFDSGVACVDVSDTASPYVQSSIVDLGRVYEVDCCGSSVVAASSSYGAYLIDFSNIDEPTLVGEIEEVGYTPDMCFHDGLLYGVNDNGFPSSVWVTDIANPAQPQSLSVFELGGLPNKIEMVGITATVMFDSYIDFIRYEEHEYPEYIGYHATNYSLNCMAIQDETIYIGCKRGEMNGGLLVVNIADPYQPQVVQEMIPDHHSDVECCCIFDNYLLLADNKWNQILIYDITEPTQPELLETFAWNTSTYDMWVEDGILYTANGFMGLHLIDLADVVGTYDPDVAPPAPQPALACRPNPFNPTTTIEFTLPVPAPVRLDVYNIRGQRVATLLNELLTAGTHAVNWQADGMASGIYFARLRAGDSTQVRKLVLLK